MSNERHDTTCPRREVVGDEYADCTCGLYWRDKLAVADALARSQAETIRKMAAWIATYEAKYDADRAADNAAYRGKEAASVANVAYEAAEKAHDEAVKALDIHLAAQCTTVEELAEEEK